MKKVCFFVDSIFSSFDFEVSGRYTVDIFFSDEEYSELKEVYNWSDWTADNYDGEWEGHIDLFNKINSIAWIVLTDYMKRDYPELQGPLDCWWELHDKDFEHEVESESEDE